MLWKLGCSRGGGPCEDIKEKYGTAVKMLMLFINEKRAHTIIN